MNNVCDFCGERQAVWIYQTAYRACQPCDDWIARTGDCGKPPLRWNVLEEDKPGKAMREAVKKFGVNLDSGLTGG